MAITAIDFYGLKISVFTEKELENYIEYSFLKSIPIICYGYSIGVFPKIKELPHLINICNTFDLMVTDGRIFYLFVKKMKFPLKYDISIPKLTIKTLEFANKNRKSVLLIGGSEINNQIANINLLKRYPNAKILNGINGFSGFHSEMDLVKKINYFTPDILLLGMHTPFKEEFAYRHKNKLKCKIIIPCGGMVDILAGKKKLTPKWVKKIGFAWLFRFLQNPIGRFRLTVTYLFYFICKLMPFYVNKKYFKRSNNKAIIDIL